MVVPYPTRSALVATCPEADEVLGHLRERHDPSAVLGVPAHITLLYPFVDPLSCDAAVAATVAAVAAGFETFEFTLDRVDSFGSRVLWAAPSPTRRFVELTRALAAEFPDHPPYGGEFGADVVPHLTVADGVDPAVMRAVALEAAELLPVRSTLSELTLLVGGDEPGSWQVRDRFPLRPARLAAAC